MNSSQKNRFQGIINIYGEKGLEKLKNSHVKIAGIGGVGSWVAEALARTGVQTLSLIDMDDVCITNTNRQIHATQSSIGKTKTEVMKSRLKDINPEITVHTIFDFVLPNNVQNMLSDDFDFFVDCTDHIPAKSWIAKLCKQNKIPFLICGGAGGKTDPSKIKVADLNQANHDQLLKRLRVKLKKEFGFSKTQKKLKVPVVFSEEAPRYADGNGGICQNKPSQSPVKLDCYSGFGSLSYLTGSFGFFISHYVINELLKSK